MKELNRSNMDKIKKFDEQMTRDDEYKFMMGKVMTGVLAVMAVLFNLFPYKGFGDTDLELIMFVMFILENTAVYSYIRPYISINEKNKMISIYEKLKWMPVSKREIQAVRMEYLNELCIKIGIANIILHQAGGLIGGNWGLHNIVFPVVFSIVIWLTGVLYVYAVK